MHLGQYNGKFSRTVSSRIRTRVLESHTGHYIHVSIHAHTYGVYPEEIDGLKRDYEKLWGEVSKVLRELSELVAK